MTDDKLDYLTASFDVIMQRFSALNITYYDLVPKVKVATKSSVVTITYTKINTCYICNCILGMIDTRTVAPICIHYMTRTVGAVISSSSYNMSILERLGYNNVSVQYEWQKIMELEGYEDGLVVDNSGVVENFIKNVYANCYKQIQLI